MKLSIIIPVLNSHEVLRRQFLYFERIGIPGDVEIIIVDDGSEPPLMYKGELPVTIHYTNDQRPWTWALARNVGANIAQGEYLLMYDLDHIADRKLIDMARNFEGQKIQFEREFAVLDENGMFTQDLDVLTQYGFPRERRLTIPPHPNMFVMRKDIFWELGGYRTDLIERKYPQGEDSAFKREWAKWVKAGKGEVCVDRPTIYMFPNGKYCGHVDYNPFGLFHDLSRATSRNPFHKRQNESDNNISNP